MKFEVYKENNIIVNGKQHPQNVCKHCNNHKGFEGVANGK
jgi:hypothetical protein